MINKDTIISNMTISQSLGNPQQLLNRSLPLNHLAQPVFLQVFHAILDRFLADGIQIRIVPDHIPNPVGDDEQFENASPPEVTGASAMRAGLRPPLQVRLAVVVCGLGRTIEELD